MEDALLGRDPDDDEHGHATIQSRLRMVGGFFALLLILIMIRLCVVCLKPLISGDPGPPRIFRATILDRHGYVLASSLETFSIYAHPEKISDKKETLLALKEIFPSLDLVKLERDMRSGKSFIWIARHVAPDDKMRVKALGIEGLDVLKDSKRIYPHGRLFCHILGTTDFDQKGMSGMELALNDRMLSCPDPIQTSLDLRIQHLLHSILSEQINEFKAAGGNGMIIDLRTGEILAMVSLPDFSPSDPIDPTDPGYFNRNMTGVYEFGSIMKILNTGVLLESKKGSLNSIFDASHPLYIGRHRITDFRGQNRPLTVEEAFVFSSNIAHAKMAASVGGVLQMAFFEKMGYTKPIKTEIGTSARALLPRGRWPLGRVMSAGFGYGFAVTPLHVAASLIPLFTGFSRPVTFLAQSHGQDTRVIRASTVHDLVYLMGQAVLNGQAKKAAAYNCIVGAKTGTANVRIGGKYVQKQNLTSSVAIFPLKAPRYGIIVSVDRAQPSAKTYGFATAGWIAAPVISRLVEELAPLLGVMNPNAAESKKNTEL